jgi:predicted nuclease of predicted toxin-antitoxin system
MRLLFDELLSYRIARALRELGVSASHVGHEGDGAPPRGSPDSEVLEHARRTNQIVVTSNHDMILLCVEKGESVIWVDPRGRQFRRAEIVPLVFNGVEEWEEKLAAAEEPVCLQVRRTRTDTLTLERASHLVVQRMRRLKARRRSLAKKKTESSGPSFEGMEAD